LALYQGNPYKIIKAGRSGFTERMKRAAKGIRTTTIERLWTNAVQSAELNHPPSIIDLLTRRIEQLWHDFQLHEHRLETLKERMAAIYQNLLDQGEQLPPVVKGFVGIENLARIAGETGPFSDFNSARQIKRYSGQNIRIRESGKYKGQRKLSKKGRPRLRLILSQSIFHLVKKDRMLGAYYHSLKQRGMKGPKAMSVVSRKVIDILFALSRPGTVFDEQRLFVSESQYRRAA
jgi:transposase